MGGRRLRINKRVLAEKWEPRFDTAQTECNLTMGNQCVVRLIGSCRGMGEGNGTPLQCSCLENPRDGESGRLPSMGLHRVGHDWSDLAAAAAAGGCASLPIFCPSVWLCPALSHLLGSAAVQEHVSGMDPLSCWHRNPCPSKMKYWYCQPVFLDAYFIRDCRKEEIVLKIIYFLLQELFVSYVMFRWLLHSIYHSIK